MSNVAELTLAGLRLAVEIAASGSFTAAGASLGYTQSAVSRQVAVLESAAGAPLFLREARGVIVTTAGAALVRRAGAVLAEVEATEHELAGLRHELTGRVRLGAFPAATAALAPRTVARLAEAHPALEVELVEAASPVQLRQLRSHRLDVAVIGVGAGLEPYDLGGLRSTLVSSAGLCVAVPTGHRLARRSVVEVDELVREPWVVGAGDGRDPQFGAWPGLAEPLVAYAVRSWPARLGFVAAGLGVCVLPALAVAAVPAGVVVVTVEDPSWAGRSAVAVTHPTPGPGADVLVATLRETAAALQKSQPT